MNASATDETRASEYFSIPENEVFPLAERFFLRAAGFDLGTEKHSRMYADALAVRDEGIQGVRVEGFVAEYGAEVYDGEAVAVGVERVSAVVFERIPPESVERVVLYVITAGECSCDKDDDIMSRLYAHMWGTAYVDAGRVILEGRIRERVLAELKAEGVPGSRLSPAFSPGFYGMDNRDSRAIVNLLGADEIGVSCVETGVMLPVKTCSGVFLVTYGSVDLPGEECLVCSGNRSGCAHCMVANRSILNV
ncbi:MAG: hypothetical protein LBS67_02685 [Clostridiales Family XIII bacterium]|nr:hypothetical protein [Clostridiales Family XIII bacterium]